MYCIVLYCIVLYCFAQLLQEHPPGSNHTTFVVILLPYNYYAELQFDRKSIYLLRKREYSQH